ncbi:uncharacterized protein [Lolium perenne]|uniref:uncharacterized protein isoform X1 n=1 Tax=Lolium perenne TaxID=4522 RepID=UPI0021F69C3D|nr:uncharacterized protein LOC127300499 isoform X2 [Lolium perenne]
MASSSSSPSSGFCISSGFKPRIFPDTLKLCTKPTYPGRLIFEAAREGSIPIMKDLAQRCRIEDRSLEVVEEIKVKDSPNGPSLGALHVAASNGNLEMCEFLIDELNLDVNAAAEHGLSPLICAIYGTAPKRIVELLLDRGAEPDIPSTEGVTVLHVLATKKDPFGIADLLLSRGANVDSMSPEGTPLHFAAQCGNLEMMEVLLKYDANPNSLVQSSYAPLTMALLGSSLKCVELVIQAGADVNAAKPVTPLIIAARYGLSDCIKCLLKYCADPNIADEQIGIIPVEIAAIHGRKKCVEILFPATSPVDKFADWSIDGIMQHVESGSSEGHPDNMTQASFEAQGDYAFEREDYVHASAQYTLAIGTSPEDPILYSKRCLCYLRMGEKNKALDDASTCERLGCFVSRYCHEQGSALIPTEDYGQAGEALISSLKLDSESGPAGEVSREEDL